MLAGKRILVGITGGIAAYKIPELVRRLRDHGAEIRVVMTPAATAFITPMTLQAVSGNTVATQLLDPAAESAMGHIELARWADFIVVAPASADFIARLTAGMANDLLSTLCLASAAPLALAPAMNQQMWRAAATQQNIAQLEQRGVAIWGPGIGEQACGDTGAGRMLEPVELVDHIEQQWGMPQRLAGQHVMITAGPTREPLDPVRYLSNYSSGKMGYALAAMAASMGAEVTLISGPVTLPCPAGVTRHSVVTAREMHQAVMDVITHIDIFIGCAAVADYRPAAISLEKIKKQQTDLDVSLVRNPDIIADVASLPSPQRPITVGFAAETEQLQHYAQDKLQRKKLDMIAANNVAQPGLGFNSDDNALHLFWRDGDRCLTKASKPRLARQMLEQIATLYLENYEQA